MSTTDLFSVKDMVVVITGGATGIGLMMTKAFVQGGAAKVYIVGRRQEKLDEAAKMSTDIIVPVVGDVTSKESLVEVAEAVKKDIGYVNLLICNSGTMPPSIAANPIENSLQEYAKAALDLNFDDWTTAFATNTVSIPFTTFAFLELLDAGNKKGNCAGRKSQVLVTSSIAGYMRTAASNIAYSGTKAAATHITKHLASALASYDIRVNAIAPGLFPSDLASDLIKKASGGTGDSTLEGSLPKTHTPATRTGKEEDMIGTTLYLASAAAAYVNGHILMIDGGRISQIPSTY